MKAYALFCPQRNIYYPAGEKHKFSSLEEIRETLADYHSVDWTAEGDINTLTLEELLDYGEWQVDDYETEKQVL